MEATLNVDLQQVAREVGLSLDDVQTTVELLDEGNTVPFITRFRKDQSGGLNEDQIRCVQQAVKKYRALADRKQRILKSLEAQGKLADELAARIGAADSLRRLEDLYLPFKPKKQTLAAIARARGLEPLATEILEADPVASDLQARAAFYVSEEKGVTSAADALQGAGHLIAEQYGENLPVRDELRELIRKTGKLVSTRIEEPAEAPDSEATNAEAETAEIDESEASQAEAAPKDVPEEESTEPQTPVEQPVEVPAVTEAEVRDAEGQPAAEESTEPQAPTEQPVEVPAVTEAEVRDVEGQPAAEESTEPQAPAEQPVEVPAVTEAEVRDVEEQPAAEESSEPQVQTATELTPPSSESTTPKDDASTEDGLSVPADPARNASKDGGQGGVQTDSAFAPAATVSVASDRKSDGPTQPAKATGGGKTKPKLTIKQIAAKSRKEAKKRKRQQKVESFKDYFRYQEPLAKVPPHRLLAINRGDRSKILRVKIDAGMDTIAEKAEELLVSADHPHAEFLRGCVRDALMRLIYPSLEREIRRELTDKAESHAVHVFARNLRQLLLQAPVRDRRVLAIDPGFRSGCKLAAIDEFGSVLGHTVIHVIGKAEIVRRGRQQMLEMITMYHIPVIAIGNGTACRETERLVADIIANELKERDVKYAIVNEAGASVYSTSPLGREELPKFDPVLRSAISIGRRLQDPLSELVKINPANIGVGLYQHDVRAKHLEESLDAVVESCVNFVGVNVNTASPSLLRYVSGLNQLTARRLYEYRQKHGPFRNRAQFKDVPGFGEATFVQAAGFLKIIGGDNPLDATWIHPESYEIAERVIAELGGSVDELVAGEHGVKPAASAAGKTRRDFGDGVSPEASGESEKSVLSEKPEDAPDPSVAPVLPEVDVAEPQPGPLTELVDKTLAESTAESEAEISTKPVAEASTQSAAEPQTESATESAAVEPVASQSSPTEATESATVEPAESESSQTEVAEPASPEVPSAEAESLESASPVLESPAADPPTSNTTEPASSEPESSEVAEPQREPPEPKISPGESSIPLAKRAADANVAGLSGQLGVGQLLLSDILSSLTRPGRDPREDLPPPAFRREIIKLEHLQPGMELSGSILNVVDFGAFVDIGLPDSGLIHISRLADRFIRDPHEVVSVGDILTVWVVEVDKQRRRVSLTAIKPGTEKPAAERGDSPARSPRREQRQRKPAPRRDDASRAKRTRTERPKTRPPAKPKPAPPITDAMVEGKEPMRSFSDLLQFHEKKKDDKKKKKKP